MRVTDSDVVGRKIRSYEAEDSTPSSRDRNSVGGGGVEAGVEPRRALVEQGCSSLCQSQPRSAEYYPKREEIQLPSQRGDPLRRQSLLKSKLYFV